MRRIGLLLSLAAALIVAGCGGGGSGESSGESTGATTLPGATGERSSMQTASSEQPAAGAGEAGGEMADAAAAGSGARVSVVDSQFGEVVADRHGEALYLFDREQRGKSECFGACAQAWPPLLTKGAPKALAGISQDLLGTTKRANGSRQVTYAGQPLYYYVADLPGTILCQDVVEFGGTWLVVEPSGAAVR